MKYTVLNVELLAQDIVEDMSIKDLMTYVFDDLYDNMINDEELFRENVKSYRLEQ